MHSYALCVGMFLSLGLHEDTVADLSRRRIDPHTSYPYTYAYVAVTARRRLHAEALSEAADSTPLDLCTRRNAFALFHI